MVDGLGRELSVAISVGWLEEGPGEIDVMASTTNRASRDDSATTGLPELVRPFAHRRAPWRPLPATATSSVGRPQHCGNDPADRLGTPAYNQEGESVMKVGIYARVARKADRPDGTIGLQLQALRAKVAVERHEVVAEFIDNGYSGLRLDRPGLDALRQAASAGTIEAVWCLSADRLARDYAYQLLILDELAGHQVTVRFSDGTSVDDARLLAQLWATMSGPVDVDGQPRRRGPKAGTHES
jgi:hypothetical protein